MGPWLKGRGVRYRSSKGVCRLFALLFVFIVDQEFMHICLCLLNILGRKAYPV